MLPSPLTQAELTKWLKKGEDFWHRLLGWLHAKIGGKKLLRYGEESVIGDCKDDFVNK